MKRVLIRADGNEKIGLGHVIRCLALAEHIKTEYHCIFAINKPGEALTRQITSCCQEILVLNGDEEVFFNFLKGDDIIVLDGYHFRTDYQQKIKRTGCKLICIDDLTKGYFDCDAIINQNPSVKPNHYETKGYTKIYSGLKYLLLRKPFIDAMAYPVRKEKVDSLFIGMGGADPYNLSFRILQKVFALKRKFKIIHLILGSANSHVEQITDFVRENDFQKMVTIHHDISAKEVADLIAVSDISIVPASSIAFECCAVKTGLITGYYANNQLLLYNFLIKNRLALPTGSLSLRKLARLLNSVTSEDINRLIRKQAEVFGDKSKDILKIFSTLEMEDRIIFTKAGMDDAQLYFEWANDRAVRENSVHKEPILWEDHIRWFKEKLNSGTSTFYLFKTQDNIPLGQLRFDHDRKQNWINFSIDKNFRGQGWAEVLIKMSIQKLINDKPGIREINALVKPDNMLSKRAFEKNSFQTKRTFSVRGEKYLEFKKMNHENRS